MCYSCWEEYGRPKIINDLTKKAAALIDSIYGFSSVGGNCHIVLDDFNIEDHHIDYCLDEGLELNIHNHNAEELEIERKLLILFRVFSEKERVSALAIHEGWVKVDESL